MYVVSSAKYIESLGDVGVCQAVTRICVGSTDHIHRGWRLRSGLANTTMKGAIFIVVACLVADAAAFKFLSNFKASSLIPRPSNLLKRRRAAEKFGTKKLAVITDASSGLGLKTAAELLRTGEYHVVRS